MDEPECVLEREIRKLAGRVLGYPERSTLDRSAEAGVGVSLRGHERMFSCFDFEPFLSESPEGPHRCVGLRSLGWLSRSLPPGAAGATRSRLRPRRRRFEELLKELTTPASGADTDASDDSCGTLLTAMVFISGAFLDPGSVSQDGLDELARNAPEEIRADIETLAQALATLAEEVGDDPTVFELEAALGSLDPEVEAAEKHLDAWQKENCAG